MKITSSELFQVVSYGLGGTLIASVLQLSNIYRQRRTFPVLQTPVESIQTDQSLCIILYDLEKQIMGSQDVSLQKKKTVSKLITSVDRLLYFKSTVEKSNESGFTFQDIEYAYMQLYRTKQFAKKIVLDIAVYFPDQEAAQICQDLQKIVTKVEAHFENFMFHMRKVYIKKDE